MALSDIAASQAKATKSTMGALKQLLDYLTTHQKAETRYKESPMVLHVHSDGSYLSAPKARSRAAGYFFLSDNPIQPQQAKMNGTVHVLCKIIKSVLGSAAECEIASAYMNAQEAVPMRNTLEELGHHQPPTPIQVDNTTALGFIKKQIKQKRSKAIDMRFY